MENKQVDQTHDSSEPSVDRTCYGCREPLPNGVSFCIACGKHNLSPDAGGTAVGQANMATHKSKERWKFIRRWFRGQGQRTGWD